MIQLSEQTAADYLRQTAQAEAAGEILVQALAHPTRIVLKVFDTAAGERVGTDLRSPGQKKLGKPDLRPFQGATFMLIQPLPTSEHALIRLERDCLELLATLLPAGSVPTILWFDAANGILATSAAPLDALPWNKSLQVGQILMDAATHAGMLLAMLHSPTRDDAALQSRFADPTQFLPQRIAPTLQSAAAANPSVATPLEKLANQMLSARMCLIHGDFATHNIILVPHTDVIEEASPSPKSKPAFQLSGLLLTDFSSAFYGHPAFDIATVLADLLLQSFLHHKKWRPFMMLADNFWQTYRHTADPDLVRSIDANGGLLAGALLLAHVDGPLPPDSLDAPLKQQIKLAALDILAQSDGSPDQAMDTASVHFDEPD